MVRIVKTEFYKLKRYHILWAGVALMLLSVLLTLFTSMAKKKSRRIADRFSCAFEAVALIFRAAASFCLFLNQR